MSIRYWLLPGLIISLSAPAVATPLAVGNKDVSFSTFDQSTQGSVLATKTFTDQSLTFAGTINLAVYRNTSGLLDFYYQFARTGPGTKQNDPIERITAGSFTGYSVNALFTNDDPDGAGIFRTGTNAGDPATARRSASGSVLGIDFADDNPLSNQQVSSTYIFRTNAQAFREGTYGVIDGSTLSGVGFEPAAVPETSAWAMMLLGFGAIGHGLRRRRAASSSPESMRPA